MKSKIPQLVSTFFGIGYLKPAPGTWGSFPGLLLGYGAYFFQIQFGLMASLLAYCLLIGFAWIMIDRFETEVQRHDLPEIVIDEVLVSHLLFFSLCLAFLLTSSGLSSLEFSTF